MKQNFTNEEAFSVFRAFGNKFNVRINRAGNIDLVNPLRKNQNEHFVLYLTPNKRYLWRCHSGYGYCYPLNMRGRKRTGPVYKEEHNGKLYYWYTRSWDIKNCEFDTVNDAIEYFRSYMRKHHQINF